MTKNILSNPVVEIALACVVLLVIATLTFAAGISGALTAAAVSATGILGLVALVWALRKIGGK